MTELNHRLWYGAAYYPEQLTPDQWESDFATMAGAGFNVVRMAEFAWIALEPRDGEFDFGWLDSALEAASRHGISAILGTPTAAPPLWLTTSHPEILREDFDGTMGTHGGRCHFNWISPTYLAYGRRIAEAMARRYGRDSRVIGWQIDNEYSNASHDAATAALFREWLKKRYGTIENLNSLWGMRYWGTDLDSFDDIGVRFELTTPCYHLAWRRFFTEQWVGYQRNQVCAMRPHCDPRQFITTNFHGMFGYGDAWTIARDLDAAGFDYYTGKPGYDPQESGLIFDMVRSVKRHPFAMLEIQPWHQNWAGVNADYPPGAGRSYVWQAIGHGGNAVLYWQYRVASGGLEQYHGALTNAAGVPRPCLAEVSTIGSEMRALSEVIAGTTAAAQCAIMYRDLDRWAVDISKHHREFSWINHLSTHYGGLQRLGVSVDIVGDDTCDLSAYRLIVAPHLHLYDDQSAQRLLDWVRAGGHLVLGVRSGVKDIENALLTRSCQPGGMFVEALGARVTDHYALAGAAGIRDVPGSVRVWAERIEIVNGATEVWTFGAGEPWLEGHPALVTNTLGAGRISYVAFYPDEELALGLAKWYRSCGSLPDDTVELAPGVERCVRRGDGVRFEVWINHGQAPATAPVPKDAHFLLGGPRADNNSVRLPGYGVAVVQVGRSK